MIARRDREAAAAEEREQAAPAPPPATPRQRAAAEPAAGAGAPGPDRQRRGRPHCSQRHDGRDDHGRDGGRRARAGRAGRARGHEGARARRRPRPIAAETVTRIDKAIDVMAKTTDNPTVSNTSQLLRGPSPRVTFTPMTPRSDSEAIRTARGQAAGSVAYFFTGTTQPRARRRPRRRRPPARWSGGRPSWARSSGDSLAHHPRPRRGRRLAHRGGHQGHARPRVQPHPRQGLRRAPRHEDGRGELRPLQGRVPRLLRRAVRPATPEEKDLDKRAAMIKTPPDRHQPRGHARATRRCATRTGRSRRATSSAPTSTTTSARTASTSRTRPRLDRFFTALGPAADRPARRRRRGHGRDRRT